MSAVRFVGRWVVAAIMVPFSVFLGILGLVFHLFTAHKYEKE